MNQISTEEMVATFLAMEYDKHVDLLLEHGVERWVIQPPINLSDERANLLRAIGLNVIRRWPNRWLFSGFPFETEWFTTAMTSDEVLSGVRHIANCGWEPIAPSLLPSEAAEHARSGTTDADRKIRGLAADLNLNAPFIVVADSAKSVRVCLDGNHRLAALALGGTTTDTTIEIILGVSPEMSEKWAFFHTKA